MPDQVVHHTLCHCVDCRRCAGAPAVAWAMAPTHQIVIQGQLTTYASSKDARRMFCAVCGTGLFYANEAMFPGMLDVQSATLDDPDALVLGAQIQTEERIGWMAELDGLPQFPRYPGPPEG